MATLEQNRDDRANAIMTYYSGLTAYNENTLADGDDTESDKPQMKFKAFNDLIKLYHDELKVSIGYASDNSAYLSSSEGVVGVGTWWSNADSSNNRSELFYIDSTAASDYFIMNGKSIVNQRHPYILWNQYNTILGMTGDLGWKDTADKTSYTNTDNPFKVGSHFLMGEPLEHYGNTTNLLWGYLVWDGRWNYRSTYCKDTDYITHDYSSGLVNFERNGAALDNNVAPFEALRYTYWGTGANTNITTNTISSHVGTDAGTFQITEGAQSISDGTWIIIYSSSDTSKGWICYMTTGSNDTITSTYNYTDALWPTPGSGDFNIAVVIDGNPKILEGTKKGTTSNGRLNVWTEVYNTYSTQFKDSIDGVTSSTEAWSVAIDDILSFDYTIINQEAGSDLGLADSTAFQSDADDWVTAWKALNGDVGAGCVYSLTDSKWDDDALDALRTDASGGINLMIAFAGNVYTGTQTGYIATRRTQIYTLLGDYTKDASEYWDPSVTQLVYNNSGYLTPNSLYFYRHVYADERLNRESGTLTLAYSGYTIYNQKISDISSLETILSAQTTDYKYDVTPIGALATTDEEDQIVLSWEQTKAAASYDIERKEGSNGSWNRIASLYDYEDPGDTPYPDFSHNPSSEYIDSAYSKGYQEFGLTITSEDDSTGLTDDFTLYDFNIAVDGATATSVSIKGMDAQTWEAMRVAIVNEFTDSSILAVPSITSGDFRITSDKKGSGSSIAITAGTTNDLIAALSTTLDTAVDGTTYLEQGKVYYYRVRVNNGYDGGTYVLPATVVGGMSLYGTIREIRLGSDGNSEDKDWDSKSEWQIDEYTSDRATHGDAGMITWDEPANLTASGVDDGITPSAAYCRLEWDASENADSYKIYRATSVNGGYAYIGTTSNTYYNDTTGIPGFIYYYKIKSVADSYQQLYDSLDTFSGSIEGSISTAGVRGKKLWAAPILTASTDDSDHLTLSWTASVGATGYVVYKSLVEDGQYSYLSNDDATELVVTTTTYVDEQAARQFFLKEFTSTSDGITSGNYTVNHRYYFIIYCSGVDKEDTIKQYYITSPSSGTWTCQNITTAIQAAITAGLNNASCSLVLMQNPEPSTYRIRFATTSLGTDTFMSVMDGTFGDSLLPLLDNMSGQEAGQGAYPAVPTFYQIEAVEVVNGEIVRRSELSNISEGVRPVI